MPAFDPKAYEEQVLKPLRRTMPHLPDDLLARYAVDLSMDAAALAERVESVLRLWNKHAMRDGPTGLVAAQLRREHDELLQSGSDLTSARFWRTWSTQRGRTVGDAIGEVAALLTASHGDLGVITGQQLSAAAAAHGALSDTEIDLARQRAGLRVVAPLELPADPGVRGGLESLHRKLLASGARNIPALLYPELRSFGLLDGLRVTPSPPGRRVGLDQRSAAERAVELEQLPDGPEVRAAKEVVGILVSEAKAGTDLVELAGAHLLLEPRRKRAEGAEPRVLFALLTRAGLVRGEAALLAVSVVAEAGAAPRDRIAVVTDLLVDGRLSAARLAAAGLTGPDGDLARAAVAQQLDRVETLRLRAREDLRAGREEQAGARLREAVGLARDLPVLAGELASVPAAPVLGVTASPDAQGARIAWRPAPDHGPETTYRVVRVTGRDPADPEDGTAVAVGSGPVAVDPAPPVGRQLHYAVFARASGGRWSRPVCASVRVVPSVIDPHIEGGTGVITGRWRVHPEVSAVEVRRVGIGQAGIGQGAGASDAPGEPIPVERNRTFRDQTAVDGVAYYYTFVACYPPVDGGAGGAGGPGPRSAPVVQRGSTRLEAKPVPALTSALVGDSVRLSWRQRLGSEVVMRLGNRPCPWQYGESVTHAQLESWGSELYGELTVKGEARTLLAALAPGRWYCVPFTVGPGGGVRGQDAVVELVEPVRDVLARRFGEDITLSWSWADAMSAVDVGWAGGRRRITRQQYREEGGCQLRGVPKVGRVEVSAVVVGGDGSDDAERSSTVVSVTVPRRPPELVYQLRRRGNRLVGGVRCTVTLTGAEAVQGVTVVLIGSAGPVLPLSVEGGVELLRAPVAVQPGVALDLPEVTVPSVLRKPYWLRCFLLEPAPAVLVDPPVSQLKVS